MNDDQLFRLILLAGFVILLPIGIYHRLESRTGEKLDRRQEGWFILVALRLCGITGLAPRSLCSSQFAPGRKRKIRFGDDYRNYMQQTGRFVPRL